MLEAMKAGEFDALLCFHTDRLYRNMSDLERVIELADAGRVEIRTVQGGTLDLSTSAGRMVARILGSVARQESEHSSERRKRANVQRAANGDWVAARRPFGYTMDGEPLEPEATAIRSGITDVLSGKSVRAVARDWNGAGLATTGKADKWTATSVRRVLLRPRYAALVVHQGKVVGPGNWTPLIDTDTHHGIVAYLNDPARKGKVGFERKYQGSGVYRCGVCGAPVITHMSSGGSPNRVARRAYACPNGFHVRRQGDGLDAYIDAIVIGRLSQPDAADLLNTLTNPEGVDIAALHAQRMALQARQEELASLFAEGAISAPQLKRGSEKLSNTLESLEQDLVAATRRNPASVLLGSSNDVAQLDERWAALSPDIRGKIIDQLLVVTINRSPKGLRRFDPAYVDIHWRGTT